MVYFSTETLFAVLLDRLSHAESQGDAFALTLQAMHSFEDEEVAASLRFAETIEEGKKYAEQLEALANGKEKPLQLLKSIGLSIQDLVKGLNNGTYKDETE